MNLSQSCSLTKFLLFRPTFFQRCLYRILQISREELREWLRQMELGPMTEVSWSQTESLQRVERSNLFIMEEEQNSKNNSLLYRLKLFYIKLQKTFVERLERFHDPNVEAFLNKHIKLEYENKIKSEVILKESEEKFINRLQRFIFEVVESMIAYIEILLEPNFNLKKQIIKSQRKFMYENIMLNIIDNKIDHIQEQNKDCIQENVQLRVALSENKLKDQAVRDKVDKSELLFLELKDQKFGKSKPIQNANASLQKDQKQGFQDQQQVNFFAIQELKQKWRRGVFDQINKYKVKEFDKIKLEKLNLSIPRFQKKEFLKEEGKSKTRSGNLRQNYQFDLLKSEIASGKKRPFSREEQRFFSSSKFILSPDERQQVKKSIEFEDHPPIENKQNQKLVSRNSSVKKRLKRRI